MKILRQAQDERGIKIVFLFVFCHTSAMENRDDVCCLNKMPAEILSYIEIFLIETEEEFIERTKNYRQEGELKQAQENYYFDQGIRYPVGTLRAFSPDKSKKVELVQCDKAEKKKPKCFVKTTDNKERKVKLDSSLYQQIAVSSCGNKVATIRYEIDWIGSSDSFYTAAVIELYNLVTQKKQMLLWTTNYEPKNIAFNKQGTQLIMHGGHWNDLSENGFKFNKERSYGTFSLLHEDSNGNRS